jgi:hypothetical protein
MCYVRHLPSNLKFLIFSLCLCLHRVLSEPNESNPFRNDTVRYHDVNNDTSRPSLSENEGSFSSDGQSDEEPTNKALIASVSAVFVIIACLICVASFHLIKSFRRVHSDIIPSKNSTESNSTATSMENAAKQTIMPATISSECVTCDQSSFATNRLWQISNGPSSTATTVRHDNKTPNMQGTVSSMSIACDQTLDDSTIYTSSLVSTRMLPDIESQYITIKPIVRQVENTSKSYRTDFSNNNDDEVSVEKYLGSVKKAYHALSSPGLGNKSWDASENSPTTRSTCEERVIDDDEADITGLTCIKVIRLAETEIQPSSLSLYSIDQCYPNGDDNMYNDASNIKAPSNNDDCYDSFSSIEVDSFSSESDIEEISSNNIKFSSEEGSQSNTIKAK